MRDDRTQPDDAPAWVRNCHVIHGSADIGQTPSQAFRQLYGEDIPRECIDTYFRERGEFVERWTLYAKGRVVYFSSDSAMLMETEER
jgi:hypothetical protein